MTTKTNPPSIEPSTQTSELLAAIEAAWRSIRFHLPDVRPALFTIGESSRSSTLNGYYRCLGWSIIQSSAKQPATKQAAGGTDLVHIEAHHLASGGRGTFTTLLHEAQHSLAQAREIQDTSRQGKYHNRAFATLAEEAGLIVKSDKRIGHFTPDVTTETAVRYAAELERLTAAIAHYLPAKTSAASAKPGRLMKLSCSCNRIIRAAGKTSAAGPIVCGICGGEFELA